MAVHQSSEILMRRNGGLVFVITIIVAYAQWLSSGIHPISSTRAIVLLILGAAYMVLGMILINADMPKTRNGLYVYIAIQVLFALAIIYLGEGKTLLAIFPIVSQVVIILPRWESWILNGVIYISLLFVLNIWANGSFNWLLVLGLFCGMIFVILFSQIVLSEQVIRGEVERLNVELSMANKKLHDYSVKVEELATLSERNRLAREIHDGLGHYLTAINMQLKAAQAVLDQDHPRVMDALVNGQNLTEEALSDVRNSIATLRGEPSLSQPLPDAIATLLVECRAEGLVAEFKSLGDYRRLTPQADFSLYRAAQEALTNVRKHALASRVDVSLLYEAEKVCLKVCDNGIGAEKPEDGFGLIGLRERVQIIHGHVSIRTGIQQGFCIEVELPG